MDLPPPGEGLYKVENKCVLSGHSPDKTHYTLPPDYWEDKKSTSRQSIIGQLFDPEEQFDRFGMTRHRKWYNVNRLPKILWQLDVIQVILSYHFLRQKI